MINQLISNLAATAADCAADKGGKLLGIIPKWYEYLPYSFDAVTGHCEIGINNLQGNPQQLWLIALAGIDILLRVAGLVAVGFVMYGGFRYLTSQGEPENTKAALNTIISALIGVGISIVAATVVRFIGFRLGGGT